MMITNFDVNGDEDDTDCVYVMMVNHVVNSDEDDNCNDAFCDL